MLGFKRIKTACSIILNRSINKFFGVYLTRQSPSLINEFKKEIEINLLKHSQGIFHAGANRGQEADLYNKLGKKVIWVEADPDTAKSLQNRVSLFNNQISYNALLADVPGVVFNFNQTNNDGLSSSIFSLSKNHGYEKIGLQTLKSIKITSTTIDELFMELELRNYDHWILDLQGAELVSLQGGINNLKYCHSLTVEVSTREVYENAPKWPEIRDWLLSRGFIPLWQPDENSHGDIVFVRIRGAT
jgi:FkbM family methyltransferase